MTMKPDPTFHASPKLAMEAPPENFAYTLLLSPDFSKPDALAVIDTKPGSPTFSQIVHTVTMPNKGDEFHLEPDSDIGKLCPFGSELRSHDTAMARPVYLQYRSYLVIAGTAVECQFTDNRC